MSLESVELLSNWSSAETEVVFVEESPYHLLYVGAGLFLLLIGLIGFSLNLLVVVVIASDAQTLWVPVNVILVNLVTGDFLMAALGIPLAMISAFYGDWYWNHETCIWYGWIMSTLGFLSIGNLTVMAVERWLLITRPTKPLSIRHAIFLSFCVWIYALCLSLPPFFGWGSYGLETGNVSCSIRWDVHDPETMSDSYIGYIFAFGLAVPVVVIVYSYTAIILTLKKVKQRTGGRSKREAKVTKMVAIMIAAFLLAWTPYAILSFAVQYFYIKTTAPLTLIPALLAKSSLCYNPVIYAGLNSQFISSLKKLLGLREPVSSDTGRARTQQKTQHMSQDTALTQTGKQSNSN